MPLHAIELLLEARSQARIHAEWEALAAAGLPSQSRHRGTSNAPHVTVVSSVGIDRAAEDAAVDAFAPILPCAVPVAGLALLGSGPYALVRVLAPDESLLAAVTAARATVDAAPAGWVGHVTLARRVRAEHLDDALAVVRGVDARLGGLDEVVLAGLRRWDPERRQVTPLL